MRKRFLIIVCLFLIFISDLSPLSFCDDIDDEVIDVNSDIYANVSNPETTVKAPETNSRACVIIDRNSNIILYGKKENEKRKMASTTKIMTATIIVENCNLNDIVEVSKKAAGTGRIKVRPKNRR